MSTIRSILLGICTTMVVMVEGNAFLQATSKHMAERVSEQDVQTSLLAEVEGSIGTGIAAKRVSDIKAMLLPMFGSLPKNQHGNLDHVTVRYALHRVLLQRHGWSVKGLDPAGAERNASSDSATGILKEQVPSYIQNLFEQRLEGRGLGLTEVAVFAATIEQLIHQETIGRLGFALNLHGLLPTDAMTVAQADTILDTYMMGYIIGENLGNMTLRVAKHMVSQMPDIYLAWPETQAFVREVRLNTTKSLSKQGADIQQLDFATLVRVAETVAEKFGKFQDAECKGLKSALMKIEDRGSGRAHLTDFYKPATSGSSGGWQFQESSAYLRETGALDESNPNEPRVMIPNFLHMSSNCIVTLDYYSVCCMNECEDLMVNLEKDVAAPEVKPARLLELVSALPSASVSAPRTLSATLQSRLEDIAKEHDGLVQLHGRLFAQWMHHAYPRECPYPHISGTTSNAPVDGWTDGNGGDTVATDAEMARFAAMATDRKEVDDVHDLMMWSHEEELLVVRAPVVPETNLGRSTFMTGVRNVVFFAAIMSTVFHLVRTSVTGTGATKGTSEKFMV